MMSKRPTWLRLSLTGAGLLLASALGGCTGDDCGRPICGCWEDVSVALDVTVLSDLGEPVQGITAICVNEDAAVATSDADGLLSARFDTRLSQACGTERCNSLTLTDPTGRCEGTQSSLIALNRTTVTVDCDPDGDDDDSAR